MRERARYDSWLFGAVMLLLGIGIIMVYSASSVVALTTYGDSSYFLKRQVLWALIGLAAFAGGLAVDHERLADKRIVAVLLAVTFLLLAATLVPGIGKTVNGARRWLRLGINIQAAELMKLTIIIYLSSYISTKGARLRSFGQGVLPSFIVVGALLGLTLLQPDFGTVMVMGLITLIMLFAGGARIVHVGGVVLALVPLAAAAVVHKAYRLQRVLTFLNPWEDPQGAGHQIVQSFIAFGSGGVFGRGLGEGRQKLLFLPERHSDFIYAVIGEDLGLWGALLVLVLFAIILWRGVRIALRAEGFSRMLALGITLLISLQALINMAVVTGLVPTKGIALPLVSYGGSALVVTLAATGVLLNISKRTA